jgi:glyoxylase-like metal-dependent hydrolase (beta-lactamase superfamily II)
MRAEVKEVADRVYNLETNWVNCHLVVEDGHAVLVDAGYPRYEARLDACLDQLGLSSRRSRRCSSRTTTSTMSA